MNQLSLVLKSIQHYFKANLWLALGVAMTTAVITGGLIVGDSVKYSLEQATNYRLGEISHALTSGDRFFTQALSKAINNEEINASSALKLEGLASSNGGQLKLNKVQVWGIDEDFSVVSGIQNAIEIPEGSINISENTAIRLNLSEGDELLLKIEKASLIPANAPFVSDEDRTVNLRAKVNKILGEEEMGRLNLQTSQTAPYNVFTSIEQLNRLMELKDKANVLLISSERSKKEITLSLQNAFTIADASLSITEAELTDEWELRSERVFIDDQIAQAVEESGIEAQAILTYFTNSFQNKTRSTPYSFISSLPNAQIDSDGIIINSWLANDLQAKVGDSIQLAYYNIGPLRQLSDQSKTFVIQNIVPIEGYFADQSLMPQIPGLSDSESCRDWQTGVPVDLKSIRDEDEEYWYQYRGLPKAFVALSTAQELWQNRYGSATAYRFNRNELSKAELEQLLKDQMDLFNLDFQLRAVKTEGLSAAANGTDFSQLFIGLSFFILVSGIILTTLLFRFNLEKRAAEIGTFSALGFSNRKIKNIFLHEGIIIACAGAAIGLVLAIAYNKLVFWGLNQVWNDIVRTEVLVPKIKLLTLLIGLIISLLVALLTIYFTLNKKLKQSTASLQKKTLKRVSKRRKSSVGIATILTGLLGSASILIELTQGNGNLNAGSFFMAGGLLLISFILFTYLVLIRQNPAKKESFTSRQLIFQNLRLNRSRSLSIVVLLAIGTYLVVSTGLNRKDLFSGADQPHSGTGGFLYWAESTVPVLHDLNNETYRKEQGFSSNFETVQMRVAEGDDASCLNLNRISNPRILGLNAAQLDGHFSIQTKREEVDETKFWLALQNEYDDCIPAIADQTVIQWSLGKKVGDTLVYQNALGEEVKLLLIAGLNASIFQGNVLIDNANFLKHFPSSSGTQVFLVNAEKEKQEIISDELNLNYRDYGMEITSAPHRLAEFMTITNTYLSIFLVLGALGLFIGTIGLGIILQRSLLERKAEFALLSSLGFHWKRIFSLVTMEYILLLFAGILIGLFTAIISVYPVIASSIENVSMAFVGTLIGIIILNGMVWIAVLALIQLRQMKLIEGLRNE